VSDEEKKPITDHWREAIPCGAIEGVCLNEKKIIA
jgi:hypothetical protein